MYACKKMKQKYERCVNVAERMVESLHHFADNSLPVSLLFCLVSAVEDPGKQCILIEHIHKSNYDTSITATNRVHYMCREPIIIDLFDFPLGCNIDRALS